jgi:hypothetical protein
VSKFIRNPNSPVDANPGKSSPSIQKKIEKTSSPKKRKFLKKCSQCRCSNHAEVIESQPKKKRNTKQHKELNDLFERIVQDFESKKKAAEAAHLRDVVTQVTN